MKETFKIRLFIADETLAVTVPKNDEIAEKSLRDAAKKVNRLLNIYREQFREGESEIGTKRLLAMTALHLAKESLQAEAQSQDSQALELIDCLDKELEAFLAK